MSIEEERIIQQSLQAFRKKRVEAVWEKLNLPNTECFESLWRELHELGATALALPADDGGLPLSAQARVDMLAELGAAAPALGVALISHLSAVAVTVEAAGGRWPTALADSARLSFAGSPLDAAPEASFELSSDGTLLTGAQRLLLPVADFWVVPALQAGRLKLAVVSSAAQGASFAAVLSSHGLRLLPFGELRLDGARPELTFDWPSSGRAANQADGLITALLTGISRELAERSMEYALVRYQGGKMIHEHDAVRLLVAPLQLLARALEPLACSTLDAEQQGDGGASSFAIELVRNASLDAIQTFGGNGYMEDYRVERYVRDTNTLETAWVHANARQRAIAARRFSQMSH